VAPPGTDDWEATAVEFLLELVPDLRGHTARRYPVVLAVIARHTVTGAAEGARQGVRSDCLIGHAAGTAVLVLVTATPSMPR
jgi:hypothetical protein